MEYKPRIIAFLCRWFSGAAADLADSSLTKSCSNVRIVRISCSGQVDPYFVQQSLRRGVDGVLVCCCQHSYCDYKEGNNKSLRRYHLLQKNIQQYGIDPARVKLELISACEGEQFAGLVNSFAKTIAEMGPSGVKKTVGMLK